VIKQRQQMQTTTTAASATSSAEAKPYRTVGSAVRTILKHDVSVCARERKT